MVFNKSADYFRDGKELHFECRSTFFTFKKKPKSSKYFSERTFLVPFGVRKQKIFKKNYTRDSSRCSKQMVGSLKMNTTLEYSTRVVQEGDRRCKKSTLNDLAYLTPLRIPLMNPVRFCISKRYTSTGLQ
jgi:hypothetical protein